MTITKGIADSLAGVSPDLIPADAYALADQIAADALAVAVAGSTEPPVVIFADYARDLGSGQQATVLCQNFRTDLPRAAFVNAASMHVLDFEPMANPANHFTSPVLPGVLALGEHLKSDGRKMATSLLLGIEMQCRLRRATGPMNSYKFHTPGVVGAMGGAVAASHMLGLGSEQIRYALGIAGSRTGGLTANSGTMTKCLHLGAAASAGLEAALLAQRGLKSNPDIIEAPKGFAASLLSGSLDATAFDNLASCGDLLTKRYAIKLFPCQYTTHWGINAALKLRERIRSIETIRRIEIDMPDMAGVNRPNPKLGLDGKFSVQYTLACALVDGWVGMDHFSDDSVRRRDLNDVLPKIALKIDMQRPPEAAGRWVEVTVELDDGSILKERCDKPEGHYHLPPLKPERHRRKLRDCFARRYDEKTTNELIELVCRFSKLSTTESQRLTALLSGG